MVSRGCYFAYSSFFKKEFLDTPTLRCILLFIVLGACLEGVAVRVVSAPEERRRGDHEVRTALIELHLLN